MKPETQTVTPNQAATRLSIIERLVLAKLLMSQGLSSCADTNDPMRFSQGILSLQDALELSLGALATMVGARLDARSTTFYDYFKKINEKLRESGQTELPSQRELALLNEARVKVKHLGLLQRPEDHRRHVIHVEPFVRHVAGLMKVDFDSLSLSDAISSAPIRGVVKKAEDKLAAGDFRACVEALATTQYLFFGARFSFGPFPEMNGLTGPTPEIQWHPSGAEHEVYLLRHGIDVSGFHRLRCLIPEWGLTTKKRELVLWWEGEHCHPGNWTAESLRWAMNFVIDMAVKLERPSPGDGMMPRQDFYRHRIIATSEVATVYSNPKPDESLHFSPPREEILKLKKGEAIEGFAWRSKDHMTLWTIYSAALKDGTGVATSYEVKVEEIAKEIGDHEQRG